MATSLPSSTEFLELKPSPLAGYGVFAKVPIKQGQCLGDYTGVRMTWHDFRAKYGNDTRYCYYTRIPWRPVICAKDNRHIITYVNESLHPNCNLRNYKLFANQDIPQGSELFLKYPKNYPRDYELT